MSINNTIIKIFSSKRKSYKSSNRTLKITDKEIRMIEFLHSNNVPYVIEKTGLTKIADKGSKFQHTINSKISYDKIAQLIENEGIKKYENIIAEEGVIIPDIRTMKAYGDNQFAIIIETSNHFVNHIWLTGKVKDKLSTYQLLNTFIKFGNELDLFVVNWYKPWFYFLYSEDDVKDFVYRCCYKYKD